MRPKPFFLFVLLAFGLVSEVGAREWTLLVYMAADNDLAYQSELDLREMEAVGSSPEVAVVVQQDVPGAGGRRYLIRKGGRILLDSLGVIDMADPAVLTQFGTWGASRFPAERYALILWDHGNGWSLAGPGGGDRLKIQSFGNDWSSGDVMGIADGELRAALEGVRRGLGRPLDLLAFDGCMLQDAEVAFEVGGAAKVMVGSQKLVPADGYPYDQFLNSLVSNPTADESTVAKALVTSYHSSYRGSGLDVTNSAIELKKTLALAPPAQSLVQAFLAAPWDSGVSAARDSVLRILSGQDIDLGDLLRLAETCCRGEVRSQAADLRDALERCVLITRASGADSLRLSGLSVWFPRTFPEFGDRALEYSGLRWVPQSGWDQIVYASYGIPGGLRPTPPSQPTISLGDGNSLTVSWRPSYSPARIAAYEVQELVGRTVQWEDGAEADSSLWTPAGFTISEGDAHTGNRSYYAYRDSSCLILKGALRVDPIAWLSLWSKGTNGQKVVCEISSVSAFTTVTPLDSLTVGSRDWTPNGFSLPQGTYYLRLRAPLNGVYLDDLKLETFASCHATLRPGSDTAFAVKNKPRGTYCYKVRAQDRQGVWGLWGMMSDISLSDFAPAYVYPNPFSTETWFVVDEAGSETRVRIHTVTGDLVRILEGFARQSDGSYVCAWDGKNENGKEVAAGIYVFLITNQGRTERGTLARIK
jgi:hypothetical protein